MAVIIDALVVDECLFEGNLGGVMGAVALQYFQDFAAMRAQITNSVFRNNSLTASDAESAGSAVTAQRSDLIRRRYGDSFELS